MTRPGLVRLITCITFAALTVPTLGAQVQVDFPLSFDNLPTYDRVNGLSIPFGPTITSGSDERLVVTPVITYRSHLGKIDPSLSVVGQLTSDSTLGITLTGARGTFTNDGWMRSNPLNSLVSFGLGHDSRNYFRADRGEARLTSALHLPIDVATIFAGVRTERDWSSGWRSGSNAGPFSVLGRRDSVDGIQRPNPLIDPGHITSLIAGGHAEYVGVSASEMLDVFIEAAGKSPAGGSFRQLTISEAAAIPTILNQRLELGAHLVATSTGSFTPRQRFAYVGGSGSLATVDLLGLGGDHLYFLDALYIIPISKIEFPLLGSPYIAPHFAAGAASVGGFGAPVQNVGGRIGLSVFTMDYIVNPRTHQHDFGVGVSLRP
ncbi:MAG: hypothetical protein ABI311_11635 [Gemmatimonadaceae bacterium]